MLHLGQIFITRVVRVQNQEGTFCCPLVEAYAKQCIRKHTSSNLSANEIISLFCLFCAMVVANNINSMCRVHTLSLML